MMMIHYYININPYTTAACLLELETKVAEDYAKFYNHITEKAPSRDTIKTLC